MKTSSRHWNSGISPIGNDWGHHLSHLKSYLRLAINTRDDWIDTMVNTRLAAPVTNFNLAKTYLLAKTLTQYGRGLPQFAVCSTERALEGTPGLLNSPC